LQQGISLAKNQALVGKTLDVLVEGHAQGEDEDDEDAGIVSLARSYRDAPEIDGYVVVDGELPPGEIVPVRITGATTYDLMATVDTTPGGTIIEPGKPYGAGMIDLDEIR
ncbi:MAG: TRAM domain-containing protein, partial [Chloroflexota bacterium]